MGPKRYSVHVSPFASGPDRDARFVREGFCWPAFVFGPFWALWHRLWWVAGGLFAVSLALTAAETLLPLDPFAAGALWTAMALLVGFEANDWRRGGLAARGFVERGLVSGGDLGEAELRWFAAHP